MSKKRANGEGNIRKRKDGRWEGRHTAGYNPETGKRIIKNVLGKTQTECKAKLAAAMEEALRYDCKVLVEEAITGAEVECAVMGNHHNAIPSDVIGEIVPLREMYDYEGKYLDGSTQLYIPARIPAEQTELIRQAAVKAYRALDCRGLSRVDFFALPDGTIRLNEINTLPGFTNISMFPKLFMASGYTYPQLLDRLIELALEPR